MWRISLCSKWWRLYSFHSIHDATNACACILSQFRYQGGSIRFYPERCAQPLRTVSRRNKRANSQRVTTGDDVSNRCQVLPEEAFDDDLDDSTAESVLQQKNCDRVLEDFSLAEQLVPT